MRNWTPEARKAQSEAIRRWQPWKNSTGPKTQSGKNICRLNAVRDGNYTANMMLLRKTLARQGRFLAALRHIRRNFKEQTIMPRALMTEGLTIIILLERCLAQFKIEYEDDFVEYRQAA